MNWLLTAWLACQALDTTTTVVALNRPGFVEANRFMPNSPAGTIGIKVGVNLGAIIWYRKSEDRPKAIPIIMAASGCAAGAVNLHAMR